MGIIGDKASKTSLRIPEEVNMKSCFIACFALAVCLCFVLVPGAGAQTLEEARSRLESAVKDKTNPLSPALGKAVTRFLEAAKKPDEKAKLEEATNNLERALVAEEELSKAGNKSFRRGDKVVAIEVAIRAAKQVPNPEAKSSPTSSPSVSPSAQLGNIEGDNEKEGGLISFLVLVSGAIGAAVLIVLIVFGVLRLRRGFWAKFDDHLNEIVQIHTARIERRQDELGKQLLLISNHHQSGSSRLESIEGELQALGRRVRQGTSDGRGSQRDSVPQAFDQYSRQSAPVLEPDFPASVDQYLARMKRNSTVVKPDFQNGILVNDLDGKGELVLIRDTNVPDDAQPLFLLPRVGQFQTKQEFHSYYERYYECGRPSAGDVWIIDPAIVSTVPGGWELREKGVLEVR
jgi:hypothetical protein